MKKLVLVDDINGEEGAESVAFALDGTSYEIDLIPANKAKLEDALRPFVNSGRRIRLGMHTPGKTLHIAPVKTRSFDPVQVRAWARANNVTIAGKGRIPAPVVEQYEDWQRRQREKKQRGA